MLLFPVWKHQLLLTGGKSKPAKNRSLKLKKPKSTQAKNHSMIETP
jgi:hypothetical protein